jgi:hypothetical protein
LESYGEKTPRLMCFPCVEDVKRKIINWRSVGRGTGRQAPPPGAHVRRGSVSLQNGGTAGYFLFIFYLFFIIIIIIIITIFFFVIVLLFYLFIFILIDGEDESGQRVLQIGAVVLEEAVGTTQPPPHPRWIEKSKY